MPIIFDPLFEILKEKGYPATSWLRSKGLHSSTVDNLRKNKPVSTETIEKVCSLLNVQPAQIMKYIRE